MITGFFIKNNAGFHIIILLLAALFCSPAFMPGKTFYALDHINRNYPWKSSEKKTRVKNYLITDPINAFYPPLFLTAHKYFKESLKNGEIPLWYRNILGRTSFLRLLYRACIYYFLWLIFHSGST